MKEGNCGSSSHEGRREYPSDTEPYAKTSNYKILISKKAKCIMIDIMDYHPGMLYLEKSDLEKMLKDLDKKD